MTPNYTYIAVPNSEIDVMSLLHKNVSKCEVMFDDGRRISADQRKNIYATLRDIAEFSGNLPEYEKEMMKYIYIERTGVPYFSLSNTDMTTAREFLQFLIEFCIEQDIPLAENPIDRAPDISRYIYCCLMFKKCCISGKKAELHHVDAVGMGRDRKEIVHLGYRVLPLSRAYHTEAHTIGQKTFDEKYKVYGIKLDKMLCEIWNVKWTIVKRVDTKK